jgi:hypothetical protein
LPVVFNDQHHQGLRHCEAILEIWVNAVCHTTQWVTPLFTQISGFSVQNGYLRNINDLF